MKAQLIYFKENGKYYTDGSIELTKAEENGQYFNIGDRIRNLSASKQLPDITGDWLAENRFIVVLQEDIGWPVLVKYKSNNQTIPPRNTQHEPGKDTNHKIRLLSFKPSGKFYLEEYITLDENCIYNSVAMVDNIVDKVSREDGFYCMICAPNNELSGCPHLILPTH